jgi:tRNA modification GTPase
LLNALLNEERAIVSEIAGTTRDTIEEVLNIDGIAYRFIDTAGLRETTDQIEQMGVERSYDKINNASILLYVADGANMKDPNDLAAALSAAEQFNMPYLLVLNKVDLISDIVLHEAAQHAQICPIAAKNGTGIEQLKTAIANLLVNKSLNQYSEVITNLRHYKGLSSAYQALSDMLHGIQNNLNTELVAFDVRSANQYLGELTGDITNYDILGSIFTRFCIGK